jgi:hypothetical protein
MILNGFLCTKRYFLVLIGVFFITKRCLWLLNGSVSILNGSIPNILNGSVPILNGSIPILNGYAPILNGSVPLLNGFLHNYWTSPVTKRFVVMLNGYQTVRPCY